MDAECSSLRLSLVICTYDRPDLVAQVLETVAQQDAPPEAYEVLVIDNASPSDIAGVVARFEGRIPGLRCIREEQVGLSHARNRGWQEARGEYVAYVDDDCKLPPQWVSAALQIARDVRPVMYGGPARSFYMTPKPRWFRDEYGAVAFAADAGVLPSLAMLSGMNMVIRKVALQAVGGFDPALGMSGMTMAYGEETALQKALRERFGSDCVYYDPALWVYHLVRPEKMSVWWIMKRRYLGGLYGFLCESRPHGAARAPVLWFKALRTLGGFILDVVVAAVRRDRRKYPALANYIWEHASYRLERLGRLAGRMCAQPRVGAGTRG